MESFSPFFTFHSGTPAFLLFFSFSFSFFSSCTITRSFSQGCVVLVENLSLCWPFSLSLISGHSKPTVRDFYFFDFQAFCAYAYLSLSGLDYFLGAQLSFSHEPRRLSTLASRLLILSAWKSKGEHDRSWCCAVETPHHLPQPSWPSARQRYCLLLFSSLEAIFIYRYCLVPTLVNRELHYSKNNILY